MKTYLLTKSAIFWFTAFSVREREREYLLDIVAGVVFGRRWEKELVYIERIFFKLCLCLCFAFF